MAGQPIEHRAPDRAIDSQFAATATTGVPQTSLRFATELRGCSQSICRGWPGQNAGRLAKPGDRGMGAQGQIKDGAAAVAKASNQQQVGQESAHLDRSEATPLR